VDVTNDGEVQFDGDGDYVERRRHKSIFDARKTARDVILNAKRQFSRGEISQESLRADARTAVEMYIAEVEQMALLSGNDGGLSDEPIHQIVLSPPAEILEYYESEQHNAMSKPPQAKVPRQGTIQTVWSFLDAPEVFRARWSVQVDVRHEGPQQVTATASQRMPVAASLTAFRVVNEFLQRSGLDIDPELPEYDGGDEPGL